MKMRTLGRNGLQVSAIGLGCMSMSPVYYGAADENESLATVHDALDHGVNLLDTADIYGLGHNERLLSQVLKERRNEVVLATKFGFDASGGGRRINNHPDYIKTAVDSSLQRLGIDHIDLYYMHRLDTSIPVEESVGVMADLVQAGKVRHLGLSEVGADTLRRASRVHPITALQSEYSLWSRDIEEQILPACRELGIGIVPYSPLGRGFLSGQIQKFEDFAPDDFRRSQPRFQGENFQINLDIVKELESLATDRGYTASQLALAWVLAQGEDLVPIPGTTKRKNLRSNIAAVEIELSRDDIDRINAIANRIVGPRYNELGMSLTNL